MRRVKRFLAVVVLMVAMIGVNGQSPATDQSFEILKNIDIYAALMKELNAEYVDNINPGELTKTGIDAMLESLDPYTNFIPESEVEDYRFITTGEYGGIGALIHQEGDFVVISEPYEGSPAQKAGLKAGDRIVEVNGQAAKGKSYDDVSAILKGQAGTTVTLTVERDGEPAPLVKTITRENIKIDNIPYYGIVGDNIGYIKLTSFTQNAAREVKQAFLKLKESNNLAGVIIDLRGNGGGLLNEAVDISNIFVERGQDIVTTKGKDTEKNRTHQTSYPPVDLTIPLVILVDHQSASASEILSGAMQDLDRGVIVGQRTFGKGLVQNVVPLSYNAQLKITVAKYYIPSGRCIQAIDYSHRDGNGGFAKIPDSLIREFKTKDGRKVYDGGGIDPDILTPPVQYSNIALSLFRKYLVFDYATLFARTHPTIPPAKNFEVGDSVFSDFLTFIHDKNYQYTTRSEMLLAELKTAAQKDNYFNAIKGELDDLQTQMKKDKDQDIYKYKDQIENLLKFDIVSRYYYQKGKIEASLADDKDISTAVSILHDQDKYQAILSGKYVQPETERKTIEQQDGEEDEEMSPADQ